jgi:hypothetical protein
MLTANIIRAGKKCKGFYFFQVENNMRRDAANINDDGEEGEVLKRDHLQAF